MALTIPAKLPYTIARRLDSIESNRRHTACCRYRLQYPQLSQVEVERLGDLVAAARIRVIAEQALLLLPEQQVDDVLSRYEKGS